MKIYKYSKDETEGMVTNKVWFIDENGVMYLFKPNVRFTDNAPSADYCEKEASRIAHELGRLSSVTTESFCYNGKIGILSRSFRDEEKFDYIKAKHLGNYDVENGCLVYSQEHSASHSSSTKWPVTLETLRNQYPENAHREAVEMLMFDTLIGNSDRHNENAEIVTDKSGKIIGFAPMFDHNLTFSVFDGDWVNLRLCDDQSFALNHLDTFEKLVLCKDYAEQVDGVMNAAGAIKHNDYTEKRFAQMQGIYQRNKDKRKSFDDVVSDIRQKPISVISANYSREMPTADELVRSVLRF